ncbi:uncharacterized protein LOC124417944 isoform X1 [Gallus gallus]|uniref:uncharacterized protein LOC124417944 isoform X1 n=1 Tax=Gallus gallus TaxID=9031 RepID=UPI001F01581E|nr:uncharacterized protein LOC124417944 isoform X1 [Gallus gallus]
MSQEPLSANNGSDTKSTSGSNQLTHLQDHYYEDYEEDYEEDQIMKKTIDKVQENCLNDSDPNAYSSTNGSTFQKEAIYHSVCKAEITSLLREIKSFRKTSRPKGALRQQLWEEPVLCRGQGLPPQGTQCCPEDQPASLGLAILTSACGFLGGAGLLEIQVLAQVLFSQSIPGLSESLPLINKKTACLGLMSTAVPAPCICTLLFIFI